MTVADVYSRALAGMHAPQVRVDVHLANGLPAFNLLGLPETEVKESRERARGVAERAVRLSGFAADHGGDGRAFVLPAASAAEAALVRDAVVLPAKSLLDVRAHLMDRGRRGPRSATYGQPVHVDIY